MKLSIIIPVYNEEKTIKEIIERINSVDIDKELVIVDDCSNDRTRDILKRIVDQNHENIKVVYSSPNRGKGYAVRHGLRFITGDVVLIQDADLEYDPNDYYKLLEPYQDKSTRVVYGSRFLGMPKNMSFLQIMANRFFNFLTNILNKSKLTDVCTCYKSFRADVIKNIPLEVDSFWICHEINAKLLRKYKIKEVPINYTARTREEGKKVNWKVFLPSAYAVVKYKILSRYI